MDELAALAAQTRALEGLPAIRPPDEEWPALEARLIEEGLAAPVARAARVQGNRPLRGRHARWLQAAAAVVLFTAGGMSGAFLATRDGLARPGVADVAESDPQGVEPDDRGGPAGVVPVTAAPSLEDSEDLVREAEEVYLQALFEYRDRLDRTDGALVRRNPVNHLVMLENVLAATEAAVREDPGDPFFNGLLVNTAAEHRATIESMSAINTVSW